MASLIKLIEQIHGSRDNDGNQVLLGRIQEDGLPFRVPHGKGPPKWRDREFEERTTVVQDFKSRVFDLENEEHLAVFAQVMDGALRGWNRIIFQRVDLVEGKYRAFLGWAEQYVEPIPDINYDGRPELPYE